MYKLLLCVRYLRTRYIALASIISVTLGVATMIVVNSVMAGFSSEMQERIHGFLADVVVSDKGLEGFPNAAWHVEQIRRIAGDDIEGMTATVHSPALMSFRVNGRMITRPVNLVGIDAKSYPEVSDFKKYLCHPENQKQLDFMLRKNGYALPGDESGLPTGWKHRHAAAARQRADSSPQVYADALDPAKHDDPSEREMEVGVVNPFTEREWGADEGSVAAFNPAHNQHTGVVVGIALTNYRRRDDDGKVHTGYVLRPGDDVELIFPSSVVRKEGVSDMFTVVDLYESKMFEYDSSFVFVPIEKLQQLRGMFDPSTGERFVSTIRIEVKPGVDPAVVRNKLRDATLNGQVIFPPQFYDVETWRDKQGPLLAAVEMETVTLNILLFMIIAVAGFGILATFFMIVVEKTKDIGILKSLGASSTGIMGVFLSYGLSLGTVGAGAGLGLGLLFVHYINEVRKGVEYLTGREVFDPTIYYFQDIPTIVSPLTVGCVLAGAIGIAVLASVLPALRAALLHPVEALRA